MNIYNFSCDEIFLNKTIYFNTAGIITSVDPIGFTRLLGVGVSSTISSTGAGSWILCGLARFLIKGFSSLSSLGVTPKNLTGPFGKVCGNSGPSWWVRKLLESTRSRFGRGRLLRAREGSVVPVLWFDRDLLTINRIINVLHWNRRLLMMKILNRS